MDILKPNSSCIRDFSNSYQYYTTLYCCRTLALQHAILNTAAALSEFIRPSLPRGTICVVKISIRVGLCDEVCPFSRRKADYQVTFKIWGRGQNIVIVYNF